MSILLDFATVLILVLFSWLGYKRGFIKTLTGTISLILSLFVSAFIVDLLSSLTPENTTFIIVLIVSFVLISFLLSILMKVINLAAKLPIISSINKILGLGCGIIFGLLAIMAAGYYLSISGIIPAKEFSDTFILNFIAEKVKFFLN